MVLEYVLSVKGNRKLLLDGHLFYVDRKGEQDKIYWKCDQSRNAKCKARVITVGADIQGQSGVHHHTADAARVEATKVMNNVFRTARETQESTHYVVSNAIAGLSEAAASTLPKVDSIKRKIRLVRQIEEAAPALPRHRSDIVLPPKYTTTTRGENFLAFDSGSVEDRMLIFSTRRNMGLLAQSEHWFADGTFKTVPHLFFQLYTIHGLKCNTTLPLVYALLPNKSEATYRRLLQELKNLQPNASPSTITTDFEQAMINAIAEEFPTATHHGCFFHFGQCIYRKIQEEGFQRRYETDADFALQMRMLSSLAFVPVGDVVTAFDALCDVNVIDIAAQNIVDYFEDNWVGRLQRNQRRRSPRFPHQMWNCHERTQLGLPRTNNAVEAWHHAFEQQISSDHPNIWRFIAAIQREQGLREVQVEQFVGGIEPPRQRKKYKDCNERIKRVLSNYDINTVVNFLRGIAHNTAY